MAATIISGGRIIDPAHKVDTIGDVLIKNGRIAFVGSPEEARKLGIADDCEVIDANGCLVTPGLIDCHVHAYNHVTPLGIDIDSRCLARGVTTVVDAGSAGYSTLPGLRKFIGECSECRLYCWLHIASHGLASAGCAGLKPGGEIDSLNQVDVEGCVASLLRNRDLCVGIKLRLSSSISDNGRNEQEAFRRSLQAAREAGVPLMVHHANSTVPTVTTAGVLSCPGSLGPGDVFTHAFHWHSGNIVDDATGRVLPDVWEAKRRGVIFDVGHGFGSFGWSVLEACAREGFWPDTISTDLHTQSVEGPAYDLTTVMTKLLHTGMPLNDVIAAVTSTPAAVIGKSGEIGSLKVGAEADVSMLRLEVCDAALEDSRGEVRHVRHRLVPLGVWRRGKRHPITSLDPDWPNPASVSRGQDNANFFSTLK